MTCLRLKLPVTFMSSLICWSRILTVKSIALYLICFQEQRQSLRQQLIEIFGCMCGLEKEMLSQLLCSVLPAELAIEAVNKKEGK